MVWHASGPLCSGYDYSQDARLGHVDEKNRRSALYANAGNLDLERRAHPRRSGYHGQNRWKRGGRESPIQGEKIARRRQVVDRALEGMRCIPGHGHADDCGW